MDKTPCRTPEGSSATNVPSWKFDVLRAAILDALRSGPVPWKRLTKEAGERLTFEEKRDLGSLGWHATTVRLEMEVRGEIERLPSSPVTLKLAEA